jgi:hypothetical protein
MQGARNKTPTTKRAKLKVKGPMPTFIPCFCAEKHDPHTYCNFVNVCNDTILKQMRATDQMVKTKEAI